MMFTESHFLPAALTISALLHGALVFGLDSPEPRVAAGQVGMLHVNLGVAADASVVADGAAAIADDADPVEEASPAPAKPQPPEPENIEPEQVASTATPPVIVDASAEVERKVVKRALAQKPEQVASDHKPETPTETEIARSATTRSRDSSPPVAALALADTNPEAVAAEPEVGGGSEAAKDSYFSVLTSRLEEYKRYPRRARQRQQEGVVKVSFTIDAAGEVLEQNIIGSSGHRLLDKEVEKLLRRASPFPPIPGVFAQTSLSVTVPIAFSLQ